MDSPAIKEARALDAAYHATFSAATGKRVLADLRRRYYDVYLYPKSANEIQMAGMVGQHDVVHSILQAIERHENPKKFEVTIKKED